MTTQQLILAYNEETIDPTYPAPKRNKHIFGVFANDVDNSFYFNPNYDYGSDNIPIYLQEVIVKTEGGGTDKYATFEIEDTEKTLVINYAESESEGTDKRTAFAIEDTEKTLVINYTEE